MKQEISMDFFKEISYQIPIEELIEKIENDHYYDKNHFFEYLALSIIQSKKLIISKDAYQEIKRRYQEEVELISNYPIAEFLKEKYIEVEGKYISIELLEFLISDCKNYLAFQELMQESEEEDNYIIHNKASYYEKKQQKQKEYFPLIQKALKILYEKLQENHYLENNPNFTFLEDNYKNPPLIEAFHKYYNKIKRKENYDNITEFLKQLSTEQEFLNKFLEYLNHPHTIEEIQLFLKTEKKNYKEEYYIYLIKEFSNQFASLFNLSQNFQDNISKLYYENDIQYKIFPQIKSDYEENDVTEEELSGEIDQSILNYIEENLPNNLPDKLSLAYALYILLGDIVRFNSNFTKENDLTKYKTISNINLDNNQVICRQWAILYHKLLKHYHIKSYLYGFIHLSVLIPNRHTIYEADATNLEEQSLTDLGRIHFRLTPTNFKVFEVTSHQKEEKNYFQNRLQKTQELIHKKLNRKVIPEEKIQELANRFEKLRKKHKKTSHNKKEIDNRIKIINYFYNIPLGVESNVERIRFFTKYYRKVFQDFKENEVSDISLYKVDEDKIELLKLIKIKSNGNIYYYLQEKKGFKEYTIEELAEIFANNNIIFKHELQGIEIQKEQESQAKTTKNEKK